MAYSNGRVYLARGPFGMDIFDVSNPTMPEFLGNYSSSQGANHVAVQGDFAYISNWADKVKKGRKVRSKWHFILIPRKEIHYDPMRHCPRGGCLVSAIEHFENVLRDKDEDYASRQEAVTLSPRKPPA